MCLLSLIISFIVCLLMFLMFNVIEFNFSVASSICKTTGIPSDLSLTMMSAGFENNIIIVMFSFEILFLIFFVDYISKTRLFNSIKDFIDNL